MAEIELLKGNPRKIREHVGWSRIQDLRHGYYFESFGEVLGAGPVEEFVHQTTPASWDNPNKAPRRSRRANPHVVMARDVEDEIYLGFAYVADDASKTVTGLAKYVPGFIQERAKLKMSRFEDHRYAWMREVVAPGDQVLTEKLMREVLAENRIAQRTTIYPWAGEVMLKTAAYNAGYEFDTYENHSPKTEEILPFGKDGPTIVQMRATALAGDVAYSPAAMQQDGNNYTVSWLV